MSWSSPFAYVVFMSGCGLVMAIMVYVTGYFLAPERIVPYLNQSG